MYLPVLFMLFVVERVQSESPVKHLREEKEEEEEEEEENGKRVQSETESPRPEKRPREEKEEEKENGERAPGECENPRPEKRQWRGVRFNNDELAKTRIILSTMWSSTPTVSGRWMTRANPARNQRTFLLWRDLNLTAVYSTPCYSYLLRNGSAVCWG